MLGGRKLLSHCVLTWCVGRRGGGTHEELLSLFIRTIVLLGRSSTLVTSFYLNFSVTPNIVTSGVRTWIIQSKAVGLSVFLNV